MPLQRLTLAAVAVAAALTVSAGAFAETPEPQAPTSCVVDVLQAVFESSLLDGLAAPAPTEFIPAVADGTTQNATQDLAPTLEGPRELLAQFAMTLRDIRYRRGGRVPATGFDCSGFVHYVFAQTLGIDLPTDSASQFQSGIKIARSEMKTGDLVFFHIHGKRISHVGIYLDHGRFIHSPTTGERVRVDSLDGHYWARRFAGAKRPDSLT